MWVTINWIKYIYKHCESGFFCLFFFANSDEISEFRISMSKMLSNLINISCHFPPTS